MLALLKHPCYIGFSGISGTPGNSHNHIETTARNTSPTTDEINNIKKGSTTMDQTTTTPTKKTTKKSTALKDTSTPRIIAHLVYKHRVGLLMFNNVALVAYIISTLV